VPWKNINIVARETPIPPKKQPIPQIKYRIKLKVLSVEISNLNNNKRVTRLTQKIIVIII
jgi:hypothetical protein